MKEASMARDKDISEAQTVVAAALDTAFRDARGQEEKKRDGEMVLDLKESKIIIFSDHHKGNRDGADDFRVCERAYNAALAYYERLGFTLVALGDVEELWEERPQTVLKAYAHTLALEGKFHQDGRYLRIWGNHDDDWSHPDLVNQLLVPALGGGPLRVHESLILHVREGEEEFGRIFLTHGHQGTLESDRIAGVSKWLVRYVWRPVQRIIKVSLNTPAKDFRLRHAHDAAMYFWSAAQEKVVLIAGHTHRPVFKSASHEVAVRNSISQAEAQLAKDPGNVKLQKDIADQAATLEWILAQDHKSPVDMQEIELEKPSYFNSGCCAFSDGDITGLEISGGEIKLVRWPEDDGTLKPKELVTANLKDVFAAC